MKQNTFLSNLNLKQYLKLSVSQGLQPVNPLISLTHFKTRIMKTLIYIFTFLSFFVPIYTDAQSTNLSTTNIDWGWRHVGWDLRFVPGIDYRGHDYLNLELRNLPNAVNSPIHAKTTDAANYSSNGELLTPEITFDGPTIDPLFGELTHWENVNPNANDMMKAELGQTYNVELLLSASGNSDAEMWLGTWFEIPYTVLVQIEYRDHEGNIVELVDYENAWQRSSPLVEVFQLSPPSGAVIGHIWAVVVHSGFPPPDFHNQANWQVYQGIFAPFWVEGVVNEEVPILHTAPLPEIPELVLEAPPGDASELTFTSTNKTCREISNAVTDEFGNNSSVGVSLGFEGSVGLIATVDIEATVEFSAGVEISQAKTSTTTSERCVSLKSGFTLPPANELGEDRSIFVGYGGVRKFGEFRRVATVGNKPEILDAGLTYYDEFNNFPFKYTISDIEDEIDILTITMNNNALPLDARTDAQNQIDVWNQVLANHANNVANAPLLTTKTIQLSIAESVEEEITVTQVESIDVDFSTGGNLGIAGSVSVAGTGVSGSTEFYMSQTRSEGSTNSTEESKVLAYTLDDDEVNDVLVIDIRRNEVYGTPIFILDEANSRTSCPYEGGFQRDQPMLFGENINGCPSESLQLETENPDDPVGFTLNICNESDETRDYTLRLIENTNNATVIVNGAVMGLNTNIPYNNIPGNGACFMDGIGQMPSVTITRDPLQTNAFLKFVLYPTCFGDNAELEETKELLVNITFGSENPNADDLSNNLVSYWSFDDSVEDHQSDNDGTIIGLGSSYNTAVFGNGIDLDGGNTYVNVGNDPSLNMQNKSLTISAWFRVDAFTDDWQALISKGEGFNYRIARFSNTNQLAYNGAFPDVIAPVNVNDGEFHHVAVVTKDGEYKKIYIDGILQGTDTGGESILVDSDLDLLIGNNPNILNRDWNGIIDDVALWDTALDDCDIEQIFNSGMSIGDMIGISTSSCASSLDLAGTQSTNASYVSGSYISSDQTIQSPAQVGYDATTAITLEEGFDVQIGAAFHAFIAGCQN